MKVWFGLGFWTLILVLGAVGARQMSSEQRAAFARTQSEMWRRVMSDPPGYQVQFASPTSIGVGDGVFWLDGGEFERVGEVVSVSDGEAGLRVSILINSARLGALPEGTRLIRRSQGQSMIHCIQMLVPDSTWQEIRDEWSRFQRSSLPAVSRELQQIVPLILKRISPVVLDELLISLRRREPMIEQARQRFNSEIVGDKLIPLLREDVWPIIERHAGPVAEVIGRQLWDRAPLFDLAWRAAYDRVISEKPVKLETRWNDFVREEAVPVLKEQEELIKTTLENILREIADGREIQAEVRDLALTVLEDPEVRELAKQVVRDIFVGNDRLVEVWNDLIDDPELVRHWFQLNDQLQKFLAPAVNILVYDGDRETINPDLAKLLRNLLLREDRQFLFLELGDGPPLEFEEVLIGIHES